MNPLTVNDSQITIIRDAFKWAVQSLSQAGFSAPENEVAMLMGGIMNWSPAFVYANAQSKMTSDQIQIFRKRVDRRKRYEPVAYIENRKSFLDQDFYVDHRVLIPRPETELLVQEVKEKLQKRSLAKPQILDMGTGSGCIAISLARLFPNAHIMATDLSEGALAVAKINSLKMGVGKRIRFQKSDLYHSLNNMFFGYFDIIVSNPPYVSASEMKELAPDLSFEPRMALYGGKDGNSHLGSIILESPKYLKKSGTLVVEMGAKQKEKMEVLFRQAAFTNVSTVKDFNGWDRIIYGDHNG
ncbi:protein-(glutamine-N5) methyltransferase, release factor-specific [bacterium F11]|nr:protein-(glutamine-N5) methyltransferase, release factor-specific [bacterium F11]